MRVVVRGRPGAGAEEPAYVLLARQVGDDTDEGPPVGPRGGDRLRIGLEDVVIGLPVNGVVVLASLPVVSDPSGVGLGGVDPGKPGHEVALSRGEE